MITHELAFQRCYKLDSVASAGLASMELNDLEDSCELIAHETSCMRHHLTWNSFLISQKSELQFSSSIFKYLPVDNHTLK